jgi:UDP:flavonoid glycosyltransferase YjiC (YdhE family)
VKAVRHVLQNGAYRAAAQRLGDLVRRDAGSDALVRELEEIPERAWKEHRALHARHS